MVRAVRYTLSDIRLDLVLVPPGGVVLLPAYSNRSPKGTQARTEQRSSQDRARTRGRPYRERQGKVGTPSLRFRSPVPCSV